MSKTSQKSGLFYIVVLFILLILLELVSLVAITGYSPNHVTSPLIEFIPTFVITWSDNWYPSLKILLSHSFMVIGYHDAHSDLNIWTIAYYPVTLFVYALGATLAGICLVSQQCQRQKLQILPALLMTAFSVTYISMIEHCAGPTWILEVLFLDKSSVFFDPKIYWYLLTSSSKVWINAVQWLLALMGLAWLIRLLVLGARKDKNLFLMH
jgi:hypothetical protein